MSTYGPSLATGQARGNSPHIFSLLLSLEFLCVQAPCLLSSQLVLPGNSWWMFPRSKLKGGLRERRTNLNGQKCNGERWHKEMLNAQAVFPIIIMLVQALLWIVKHCRLCRSNDTPDFFQTNKAGGSFSNQEHSEQANRLWPGRCFSKCMWISQWERVVKILYLFLIKLVPVSKLCSKR